MFMVLLILGVMYDYRAPLENKVDPRCYLDDYAKVWVYFTDKGVNVEEFEDAIQAAKRQLSPASGQRRALRRGITDHGDLPLHEDYVAEVEAQGAFLIRRSKWLNAASFIVARDDIDQIAQLDFVHKIRKVAPFSAPRETEAAVEDTAIYGLTYRQSQMFGIDRVHEIGIFGSNIVVGILDTGLRRRHIALRDIFLLAEYDFLGGDQLFLDNDTVTSQYGTYGDIVFHETTMRLNIFFSCDTVTNFINVRDIFHTYSTDGYTWEPLINITHNLNHWARELDVCGRDTMFLFYREKYGSSSLLKYTVIAESTLVSPTQLALPGRREPSSVNIGDTVYVVFQGKDGDQHKLFMKQGNISGFGSETPIDSSTSSIKAPKTIGSDSEIGVFYHIFPEDTLYFIKATLPADSFVKTFVTRGKDAEAITSGDTIFTVWKDRTNGPLFRIAFATSSDFGTTLNDPIYLSEELNAIGKISMARSGETITVSWETAGRIYYRTSNNNGASFGNLDSLSRPFAYLPTLAEIDGATRMFYCARGDSVTDGYSSTDPDYWHPRHGTEMLGVIGGDFDGRYRGVAPGAQFLVAKTENPETDPPYEFPVEEDTYIAGLEWCESMGADIVSSSLGYSDWYSWPLDYDGRTSPASIAAHEATKRGMVVVTAAGNVAARPRLDMPGDAIDVITVGGIDTLYNLWEYSGYGPTQDGRMKPEIVCLSDAPVVVDPDSTDSYLYSTGTSGATALTAGICALLLEAHPNWDVDSVRNALFSTASYANTPNDSMGYGWPDAFAAIHYSPIQADTTRGSAWLTPFPNPFLPDEHNNIYVPFKLDRKSSVEIRVYSMSGKLIIEEEREGLLPPGNYTDTNPDGINAAFVWDGKDSDGKDVACGIYYCVLNTHGAGNDVTKIAVVR